MSHSQRSMTMTVVLASERRPSGLPKRPYATHFDAAERHVLDVERQVIQLTCHVQHNFFFAMSSTRFSWSVPKTLTQRPYRVPFAFRMVVLYVMIAMMM